MDNKKEFEKLILDKADVLLISEKEQDYQDMLEYGFKRVDYFNSYMIAEEYFKNHETQLDSYDLVLVGDTWAKDACCYFENDFLENNFLHQSFCNLGNARKQYCRIYESDNIITDTFKRLFRNLDTYVPYYETTEYLTNKQSLPIKTTLPTVPKKPLPTFKKDLNILFLGYPPDDIKRYFAKLGLNMITDGDDNNALSDYVVRDLGKYDIIATTEIYSGKVLSLLEETKKQQERTGQTLTMLCTYKENVHYVPVRRGYSQYPDCFTLGYSFVGSDATGQIEFGTKASNCEDCPKALMEGILNIYNEELKKLNQIGLKDYDLRTIDEINKEHEELLQQEEEEGLIFDNAYNSYENFIRAVRNLIYHHIYAFDNMEIFSNKEKQEVTINMQYNNRTICSITIPYYYNDDKTFSIQRLGNKGKLLPSEKVLIYSDAYFSKKNLPRKATIEELKAFNNVANKVINKAQELPKEKPYVRRYNRRRY